MATNKRIKIRFYERGFMKNKQLIAYLQNLDPELEVCLNCVDYRLTLVGLISIEKEECYQCQDCQNKYIIVLAGGL